MTPAQALMRAVATVGGHGQGQAILSEQRRLQGESEPDTYGPGCTLTGLPAYAISDGPLCGEGDGDIIRQAEGIPSPMNQPGIFLWPPFGA